MAVSGSVSTSKYQGRYYTVSWTATQDVSTNKSTISWTLKAVGGSSSWYAERTLNVTIAGTEVYSKTSRVERYTGTIKTGTITLTHDSSGNKSFTIKVNAAVYVSSVNCTGSKSFTLTQIPRQANITSAENFNDEGNPVIKYSNPAGSAATTLQACIASTDGKTIYVPYRDITKTGTSYTFSLTTTERNNLRNACSTANSMSVKFYVKTVIGGTTFYSTSQKTLSIINATPTLNPTATDSNTTMTALTGDANTMVKYYSNAAFTFGAAALKGATIKSYKVTCGSKSSTASSGTLSAVDSGTFVFSITDSRGNTASKTLTKTLVNYVKLTNVLSATMSVEGVATAQVKGNYFNGSIGATANTITVKYRYKVSGGTYSSWTTATATKSGNTYTANITINGLDYRKKYVIQASAADKIMSLNSNEVNLNCLPVFDWGEEDFNFNVPVNGVNMTGLFNALTKRYELTVTATPGGNYSSAEATAHLYGTNLRVYVTATRSSSIAAGDVANETIATIVVNHGGKIKYAPTVYFPLANNGGTAYSGSMSIDEAAGTLTFNVVLSCMGTASSKMASYFSLPIVLDLDAYE